MRLAHKTKIGGTAYEIGSGKVRVGGTGYSIDKGRTKVDGTGYDISFGTPIGSLAVGTSVYFNYEGSQEEFIVVHQGNPDSTVYDASCDGTWLLQKEVHFMDSWDYQNNDYKNSFVHECLSGEILGFFDSNIQSAIKQVKIPYWNSTGSGGSLATGSNGLTTKLFLLSCREVGWGSRISKYFIGDGACLDYFSGCDATDSKRIAYEGTGAGAWCLRTPHTSSGAYVWYVDTNGGYGNAHCDSSYYYRPAFILPAGFDATNYLA